MNKLEKQILKEKYFHEIENNNFYIDLYSKNKTEYNNMLRKIANSQFYIIKDIINSLGSNLLIQIENEWIIEQHNGMKKEYLKIIKETLELNKINHIEFNNLEAFFDELEYMDMPDDTKKSLNNAYVNYLNS